MRVIVTGSRDWEGILPEVRIGSVLLHVENLALALRSPLVVVHGGCPTGADAAADRWCRRRDMEPEIHLANWGRYGKGAGPIRNAEMALTGADMCLAFLRGPESKGTKNMIEKAREARIPTFVIDWENVNLMEDL